jgi:hemerythrin
MEYTWDPALETGHEKIDKQHKQLVIMLNNLIQAAREGKDTEEVLKFMDFLTGYTIMHFKTEEDLMVGCHYPDYHVHRGYHEDFKATVGDLTKRFIEEGPTPDMIRLLSTTIGEWLVNHIRGDDFRMAAFVKTINAG